MSARFPLYARVLCWFFLNIGLIGTGLYFALKAGGGGQWLVMQQAGPRLQSLSVVLVNELQTLPESEWTGALQRYSAAYSMKFTVFGANGRQLAGEPVTLPDKVRERVIERPPGRGAGIPFPGGGGSPPQPSRPGAQPFRPNQPRDQGLPGFNPQADQPQGPRPGAPGGPGIPVPRPVPPGASFAKWLEHSDDPSAWWFIVRIPLRQPTWQEATSLVLMTENLAAGGLLLDLKPWLWGAAGLLVVSSLLWLPFVRGLTRHISGMKQATARIAGGRFDVQVPDNRRDELGELAAGINAMASRLSGFVSGQKRFLGDIAHELCTPLARMQMAGAALEQRAPEELKPRIADLTVEVEEMSRLVAELLDFSRAGLAPRSVPMTSVPLLPLAEQVTAREGAALERMMLRIPPDLAVRANAGLLSRALANVVRNALRYAGPQARVEISAVSAGNTIQLTIADDGPGVPEEALPCLFDPFFRLEAARDRESGGTGLGLAIVKTCLEACGGSVSARNRKSGGLEVAFRLAAE